jgi:hypothetical protein
MERAKIITHRSSTRGTAEHGWLKSFYTFKVGANNDSPFESFGCLRVLNEDRDDDDDDDDDIYLRPASYQ